MIISHTELINSDNTDGSLFLFRHTERSYGDFSMEVKKENVASIAQNLRVFGSKRRKKNG